MNRPAVMRVPLLPRLLLALVLLTGQAVLAWHSPSHLTLDTIDNSLLAFEDDCQLGAQAHAPALPPALPHTVPVQAGHCYRLTDTLSHPTVRRLVPVARAPPLSA